MPIQLQPTLNLEKITMILRTRFANTSYNFCHQEIIKAAIKTSHIIGLNMYSYAFLHSVKLCKTATQKCTE